MARAASGGDPSDATPALAAAMALSAEPWPSATSISTAQEPAEALADALARITPQHRVGRLGSS